MGTLLAVLQLYPIFNSAVHYTQCSTECLLLCCVTRESARFTIEGRCIIFYFNFCHGLVHYAQEARQDSRSLLFPSDVYNQAQDRELQDKRRSFAARCPYQVSVGRLFGSPEATMSEDCKGGSQQTIPTMEKKVTILQWINTSYTLTHDGD